MIFIKNGEKQGIAIFSTGHPSWKVVEELQWAVAANPEGVAVGTDPNLDYLWSQQQEAGAHVTRRLADGNLERIRRLFSYIQRFVWRRVEMVRLFCSQR